MSVPANLMQQMMKQQGGKPGGEPPASSGPGSSDARTMPPAASPFATPQEKRGLKASAMANVSIALSLLEQSVHDLGLESTEGETVMKAIEGLHGVVGERDNSDLVPAEIMQMVKSLPQMGGGTDVQQELARQQAEKSVQQRMKMQQAAASAQPQGGGGQQQPGAQ